MEQDDKAEQHLQAPNKKINKKIKVK